MTIWKNDEWNSSIPYLSCHLSPYFRSLILSIILVVRSGISKLTAQYRGAISRMIARVCHKCKIIGIGQIKITESFKRTVDKGPPHTLMLVTAYLHEVGVT